MNDILLGEDGWQIAADSFMVKYRERFGGIPPESLVREAICRAQVQKVCKWLESDCTEHAPPAYVMSKPMIRVECPECWQVLRAVAGLRREETHGIRQGHS